MLAGGELGMLADLDEVPGMDRDNEMKRRHVFNDRPFCTYKVHNTKMTINLEYLDSTIMHKSLSNFQNNVTTGQQAEVDQHN